MIDARYDLSSLCGIWVFFCLLLTLISCTGTARAAEFHAANPAEVAKAMQQAMAGDSVILADGEWRDAELLVIGNGVEDKPITVRAATPGKVVLAGESRLHLAGSYLQIEGLLFERGHHDDDVIAFRADSKRHAHHCRVTECAIREYDGAEKKPKDTKWVSLYGTHNRFDHCHLAGKTSPGTTLVVWLSDSPNEHRIDHNHFGPRPPLGENGGETIRVGDSNGSLHSSRTLVESNLFYRCNGEIEIVSTSRVTMSTEGIHSSSAKEH